MEGSLDTHTAILDVVKASRFRDLARFFRPDAELQPERPCSDRNRLAGDLRTLLQRG
jgi:hypothetical protein